MARLLIADQVFSGFGWGLMLMVGSLDKGRRGGSGSGGGAWW